MPLNPRVESVGAERFRHQIAGVGGNAGQRGEPMVSNGGTSLGKPW